MTAVIGSPAPPFSLPDQHGDAVSLADVAGRSTLVVFIPFPFTRTCEAELCAIRDHRAQLERFDANVVAITCDTRFANKAWSDAEGFGFPVLSDFWPHGEVARAYGAFNEAVGAANRETYVLDADGILRDVIASGSLGVAREFDVYTAALAKLADEGR